MIKNFRVDQYLHMIGEYLQIGDAKYQELSKQYDTLSDFIYKNHELVDDVLTVYQNGSFSIKTVVAPLRGDEFDVDMVVEFDGDFQKYTAKDFHDKLYHLFLQSDRYKDRVEQYRNVVRIKYSNNFHFDIMPGFKHETEEDFLRVPDIKSGENGRWVARSPIKYKEWFVERTKQIEYFNENFFIDSKGFLEYRELEKEELTNPNDIYLRKPTLERMVQLMKRIKDNYFKEIEDDYIPSSIIITTLLARHYNGEKSIFEGLYNTIRKIEDFIGDSKSYIVSSPVNTRENYARKWQDNRVYYERFKGYINHCLSNLNLILTDETKNIKKGLLDLFGQASYDNLKEKTKYDALWNEPVSMLKTFKAKDNNYPNEPVEIKKKERGNA